MSIQPHEREAIRRQFCFGRDGWFERAVPGEWRVISALFISDPLYFGSWQVADDWLRPLGFWITPCADEFGMHRIGKKIA